jgi:2-keto-3-deoxy-6-phosphogluconate aldolase
VALDTLENYFAAGAAVVGVGNAIVPLEALRKGELDAVRAHAERFLKRRA